MINAMEKNQYKRMKSREGVLQMLDGVKESLTKKVTFQRRAEGSEGIRLMGRAFQVKGQQEQKQRSRVCLVRPRHRKPASGCGKVLYLTHCASAG